MRVEPRLTRLSGLVIAAAISAVAIAAVAASSAAYAAEAERSSKPGEYSGYSPVLYDGYQLSSQYVAARDGTKLALDIYRPTLHGVVVAQPLPVIWMNTPYNRRNTRSGLVGETYPGAALALVKYGYVMVVADMRGDYASFGKAVHSNRNEWMPWAYWDAYDITEWLAAQPWSDSHIGMWGCSATGHSQWQAAATKPPHLKAIFPLSAPSEYYDWGGITPTFDKPPPMPAYPGPIPPQDAQAVPVDGDTDGELAAAKQAHRWNLEPGYMPFRDSAAPELQALLGMQNFKYWLQVNTFTHLADINQSGIPAYESSNFGEDMRVKLGVAIKLHNIKNPLKLIYAPGNHCNWSSPYEMNAGNAFDITVEELRWFDYWLKGVQNGIMDEPPIYYYTYNLPLEQAWKFAWQWPVPTERDTRYFFGPQLQGGPRSGVNDGSLSTTAPGLANAKDDYTVDYTVTPENQNDKGMTYTTPALATDTTLVGHPVVHLWIASTATDGDFLGTLLDVAPDGSARALPGTYDGRLRASMRALHTPPYDNMGLPYHRSFAQDAKPLTPGQPTELVFDMAPISYVFKAGHRIRFIIACVAAPRPDNPGSTPVLSPPPIVSFYRDARHSSYILLPVNAPIEAQPRIVPGKSATMVYLTFPARLDRRYLDDVKPGSVRYNDVPASNIEVRGNSLLATFPVGSPQAGTHVTLHGEFGGKYYYGDLMSFTVRAIVPEH